MIWRIEIKHKKSVFDAQGDSIKKAIMELGIISVSEIEVIQVYNIEGELKEKEVDVICKELLVDKITQQYKIADYRASIQQKYEKDTQIVEIEYNPGVMDPVEASTIKGIKDLGFNNIKSVRTAKKYILFGSITNQELELIADKVLSNKIIQHVVDLKAEKREGK